MFSNFVSGRSCWVGLEKYSVLLHGLCKLEVNWTKPSWLCLSRVKGCPREKALGHTSNNGKVQSNSLLRVEKDLFSTGKLAALSVTCRGQWKTIPTVNTVHLCWCTPGVQVTYFVTTFGQHSPVRCLALRFQLLRCQLFQRRRESGYIMVNGTEQDWTSKANRLGTSRTLRWLAGLSNLRPVRAGYE